MGRKKALTYTVIALMSFFISGFVVGYVTHEIISYLHIDTTTAYGSAFASAIASVVGFIYRKRITKLLKKAIKALFEKRHRSKSYQFLFSFIYGVEKEQAPLR